jgi:hypothetical protein
MFINTGACNFAIIYILVWPLKGPFIIMEDLLGACVFGDCLGALTDGVLGQLSREKEADCGLYFAVTAGGHVGSGVKWWKGGGG